MRTQIVVCLKVLNTKASMCRSVNRGFVLTYVHHSLVVQMRFCTLLCGRTYLNCSLRLPFKAHIENSMINHTVFELKLWADFSSSNKVSTIINGTVLKHIAVNVSTFED